MRRAEGEPLAATLRPPPVARLVGDDGEEPGPHGSARAEARQGPPRLDEAGLGGVLGVGGVAGDQVRGAEGDLLVLGDERSERVGVAAAGPFDELVLSRWSAHHSSSLHHRGGTGSAGVANDGDDAGELRGGAPKRGSVALALEQSAASATSAGGAAPPFSRRGRAPGRAPPRRGG